MAAVPSPRPSGVGERARGPQLRVVDEPRHTRRYMLLLALVAVLGVTGIVSLNALAAEASFEAQELEDEVAELSHRYDELTAEVAELESPERVRRVATAELGMVPADPVYLGPEGERTARPADTDAEDGRSGPSGGGRAEDPDEAETTP